MTNEPVDLIEARALLGKFEAEMHTPKGIEYLTKALSRLADLCADETSEDAGRVASNVVLAYAGKVQRKVESLLSSEPSVHLETLDHWQRVFAEFEQFGFTLPPAVTKSRSKILGKMAEKAIESLTPAERKALLETLQAIKT